MSNVSLSFTNLKEIRALLVKNNFSYSLPEGQFFVSEAGISIRKYLPMKLVSGLISAILAAIFGVIFA